MKRMLLIAVLFFGPHIAFAGTSTYDTPGTYTFTVPAYGALTVQVWGGGASGNDHLNYHQWGGVAGGTSSFNGAVIAYGGGAGGYNHGGSGGGAAGGDTNITGGVGLIGSPAEQYQAYCTGTNGAGGSSPNGGAGGGGAVYTYTHNGNPGSAPGGAGAGGYGATMFSWPENGGNYYACDYGNGGGGGGYSSKTYATDALTPGSTVTVVVGAGGVKTPIFQAHGGVGAPGQVTITWTDVPAPTCSITLSPNPVNQGSSSLLSWSSSNATTVYIANVGYVAASGSAWVTPSQSTSYSGSAGNSTATVACSGTTTLIVNQSCALPWGGSIAHGNSATAYQASTVSYGSSCVSQSRTCSNGSLSGSYAYASCSVTPAASCTLDGTTVAHGSSRTFFSSQSAPSGQLCSAVSQTRTCNNGTLSGSSAYQYASCMCPVSTVYSCSGQTIMRTNTSSSCGVTTSEITSCVSPTFCSAGSAACINPTPDFVASEEHSGHLEAVPRLVRSGDTSRLYWNVANVESCTVSGSNGDSWTELSSGVSGVETSVIGGRTDYTLECDLYGDATFEPESATVNIIPIFDEQ